MSAALKVPVSTVASVGGLELPGLFLELAQEPDGYSLRAPLWTEENLPGQPPLKESRCGFSAAGTGKLKDETRRQSALGLRLR